MNSSKKNRNGAESITVMIRNSCTNCQVCLSMVSTYVTEWINAVAIASGGSDTKFKIGPDGMADFDQAQAQCPSEAIEQWG